MTTSQFPSELIPLRTDFIFLEQFYIEEKVDVFLSSREKHMKFSIRATKTNKWKQTPYNERDRREIFNSSHKTICWVQTEKHTPTFCNVNENEGITVLTHFYVN